MNKTNKVLALTGLYSGSGMKTEKLTGEYFTWVSPSLMQIRKAEKKALHYREMYGGIPSYAHVHSKYTSGAQKSLLQILFVSLGKLLSMSLCWVSPLVKCGYIFYLPHRVVVRSKLINTGKVQCMSQGKHTIVLLAMMILIFIIVVIIIFSPSPLNQIPWFPVLRMEKKYVWQP